jgi:suppressor for copper-sensitivity B
VLPIAAKLAKPGEPAAFNLAVDFLTCSEICVPVSARLTLDLPAGPAGDSSFAAEIAHYRTRVPGDGSQSGLSIESVAEGGTKERPYLEISARAREPLEAPDVFVEGPPTLRFGVPEVMLGEGGHLAQLSVPVDAAGGADISLRGAQVTITLIDGARAAEKTETVAAGLPLPEAAVTEARVPYFLGIIAVALLGGLILNLMPCVLPVLSLKLLSVVSAGGRESRDVRIGFLASATGIVASFLLLAGAAIGFREAGYLVGWGVQFQHPGFLILMVLLLAFFACNLWGLFELRLPGWLSDAAVRRGGQGLAGNFATGAFATLLATPCSAPFLGTAVGFALSRGAFEIVAVFAALGLGMSIPYLAVAAFPRLAGLLPRPGAWMIWLKKILALALAGTALWLVSVLAAQASNAAAISVAALAAVIAAVFALTRNRESLYLVRTGAIAALALFAFLVPALVPAGGGRPAAPQGYWKGFDAAAIPSLVATGHVVMVDVTADWCLTCKVNEKLVLNDPAVSALLARDPVVAMRADWTRRDDTIARYLRLFGRYGIPFNAVYGPGAPGGIALPEILTRDSVRGALEKAGSGPGRPDTAKDDLRVQERGTKG